MSEKWIRWEPIPNLENKYYVESILDNFNSLSIILASYHKQEKVIVSCESSVDAFKTTYESFRQKTIYEMSQKYGGDVLNWTFYKVEDSSYLQWLSEESYTLTDALLFSHYALIAGESIVDIITGNEPTVELIKSSEKPLIVEQWTRWEPTPRLAKKYYIESIFDRPEELKVVLTEMDEAKTQVIITFEGSVDGYTRMSTTYRDKLLQSLNEKYGIDFYRDWTFFKVSNSRYIKNMSDQLKATEWLGFDNRNHMHFSLIAAQEIVDIVAAHEPKVEIIKIP